jgi:hypothetical protein
MRLLVLFMIGLLCFTLVSCPKKDAGAAKPKPAADKSTDGNVGDFNEGGE